MATVPTVAELADMHLMNPTQRESIQGEIRNAEAGLRGFSMLGNDQVALAMDARFPQPDTAGLRESIKRDSETLQRGTAPEYNGYQKNKIFETVKTLSEDIREGMPSHDQMEKATYENVELHMRWEEMKQRKVEAWRAGMRILDPDHEHLSAEILRPDRPTPMNYKAYLAGYEQARWTQEHELEAEMEELDDETYLEFLKLKAQGISTAKLIQRKIGLSQARYEACMARLENAKTEMDEGEAAIQEAQTALAETVPAKYKPERAAPTPQTIAQDAKKVRKYYGKFGTERDIKTVALHTKMSVARVQAAVGYMDITEGATSAA